MNQHAHAVQEKVGELPMCQTLTPNCETWKALVNELIQRGENCAKSITHKHNMSTNQGPSVEQTISSALKIDAFIWQGALWIKCFPVKTLFRSTTIHEVVNRGDIFAVRLSDGHFTVISESADILKVTIALPSKVEVTLK